MDVEMIGCDSDFSKAVLENNIAEVGQSTHDTLVTLLENGHHPYQTLYAVNDNKIARDIVEHDSFEARADMARNVGRRIAKEFTAGIDEYPVKYLIQTALCYSSNEDSGYSPNDDPYREECCVTIVAPVEALCKAETLEEHMSTLQRWNIRVWFTKMHEGAVKEHTAVNALMVSTTNYKEGNYDTTEENVFSMTSNLLNECIIGMSSIFPAMQQTHETKLDLAIALELAKKRSEASLQDKKQ